MEYAALLPYLRFEDRDACRTCGCLAAKSTKGQCDFCSGTGTARASAVDLKLRVTDILNRQGYSGVSGEKSGVYFQGKIYTFSDS